MTPSDIERIYEAMAEQIDGVGPDHAQVYLAKLALLLAQSVDDPDTVMAAIRDAARSLDV